jgi:hypothetical protein
MEGVVANNAIVTRAVTGFLQHSTHQLREPTFQQPLYAVLPQMALAAPPLAYGNTSVMTFLPTMPATVATKAMRHAGGPRNFC